MLRMELAAALMADEDACDLQDLVEEHKRMVYRIAYSVLRNHHDAEDAAQETFLRVWRAGWKLTGIADRKAWIARIAWNVGSDLWRKPSACAPNAVANLADTVNRLHDRGASAEEIAAGAELQRLLEGLIAGLPHKLREVLVLSTVEDLDAAEIGRVLGLNGAAVRLRLFQARRLLREKLDRLLEGR